MATSALDYTEEPLGPEDAFGRELEDIEQSFIDVGLLTATTSLPRDVADIRVLVGRKGSGKTHILRHVEIRSRANGRLVTRETLDENFLFDGGISQFRGTVDTADAISFWTNCWRMAVAVAAFSLFSCRRPTQRAIDAIKSQSLTIDDLKEYHKDFIFNVPEPIGPVSSLKRILAQYKSFASLNNLFRSVDFSSAENAISRLLHQYGELHFLIDGLDEFAWIHPRSWLEPQLGLFKLVFLQSTSRSNIKRLFLTITLRNYVYTHALRDTHRDRVSVGAGVVPLIWDYDAASAFLTKRLNQVRSLPFARANLLVGERPLASSLGFETFVPQKRGRSETVEYYLLRHTRCSPRHIIQMFTKLCKRQNVRVYKGTAIDELDFEDTVREHSREIAANTLKTAAEEILSFFDFKNRRVSSRSLRDAAQEYFVEQMEKALSVAISACGKEISTRSELRDNIYIALTDITEDPIDDHVIGLAEESLWRSGIIAYRAQERGEYVWRYTWSEHEIGLGKVPDHVKSIGFHPSIVTYCNLEVLDDGPVF